jgi:hypothetical protein
MAVEDEDDEADEEEYDGDDEDDEYDGDDDDDDDDDDDERGCDAVRSISPSSSSINPFSSRNVSVALAAREGLANDASPRWSTLASSMVNSCAIAAHAGQNHRFIDN